MNTPYTRLLYRIGAEKLDKRLFDFCKESNAIEGEKTARRSTDMAALETILKAEKLTEAVLLDAHRLYAEKSDLREDERGAYRKCQVYVGRYVPPKPSEVQKLMDDYFLFYGVQFVDSYRAHCMFEQIHPFVDFNGRTGRALWLRLAILEGYDCSLGFLHKFYYQTLTAFR
jgi:Fic family protein